ncbi:hypothetical protein V8C86DRAFT_2679267 [Haematococcus lacustris]
MVQQTASASKELAGMMAQLALQAPGHQAGPCQGVQPRAMARLALTSHTSPAPQTWDAVGPADQERPADTQIGHLSRQPSGLRSTMALGGEDPSPSPSPSVVITQSSLQAPEPPCGRPHAPAPLSACSANAADPALHQRLRLRPPLPPFSLPPSPGIRAAAAPPLPPFSLPPSPGIRAAAAPPLPPFSLPPSSGIRAAAAPPLPPFSLPPSPSIRAAAAHHPKLAALPPLARHSLLGTLQPLLTRPPSDAGAQQTHLRPPLRLRLPPLYPASPASYSPSSSGPPGLVQSLVGGAEGGEKVIEAGGGLSRRPRAAPNTRAERGVGSEGGLGCTGVAGSPGGPGAAGGTAGVGAVGRVGYGDAGQQGSSGGQDLHPDSTQTHTLPAAHPALHPPSAHLALSSYSPGAGDALNPHHQGQQGMQGMQGQQGKQADHLPVVSIITAAASDHSDASQDLQDPSPTRPPQAPAPPSPPSPPTAATKAAA